ncbi:MAG: TPM domain-containing protein [Verrucomicrobiota bacterium]|nr:TPM domain-containing protein [Verrucomicrobiota bacterium]
MKRLCLCVLAALGSVALAAEKLPPPPAHYFNDYAHAVRPETAAQLDAQLEQFERDTSSQIVVAIFPKMETDSSIEDYVVRIAESWRVGQKKLSNGAVLFVFVQDRKISIQVGYGLEGALPDVITSRIREEEIAPRFRQGDFDGGIVAGVNAMLAATRGEYKGSGRANSDSARPSSLLPLIFFALLLFVIFSARRRGTMYRSTGTSMPWFIGGGGGGGWSSGGGGGGFSGGGGSFGGGGSSGSW